MEEVLLFLLKQSAVVVALGLGNWAQWKEKKELKEDMLKLVEAHNTEKRELNTFIQNKETENAETLARLSITMDIIKDNLKSE
jgi:hypothetical protein